ncbi:hypothetical protein [Siccirubricoccus sp. G192]|uniref:hypothetical protein n=1 Tax=Siccirubricoccus sp. G192 TaxID=2849651 RepID=UPI001C2BFE62|nr:hypothetical protein [Siccirubricoccus sp. G192]MBV1799932.1 hypothetical protein [Siccirubricoccus sp. G192]
MRAGALLLLALAAAALAAFGGPALLEAWLFAFLFWASLALGSLGALAIGHLLKEEWLRPVRGPLEAAARTMPLLAVMAVPVLLGLAQLYPWAGPGGGAVLEGPRALWLQPWPFRLRAAGFLALWIGLAWLLARPGRPDRRLSALVFALLLPSVTLAAQDWSLSRDPAWFGSLQGIAAWVEGLAGALAAATLTALARGTPSREESMVGLERALLTLALAVLWLWFTQYIVVWMADLPAEAGWYLRRMRGGWAWMGLGLAVPALLAAILLAAPPRHGPWRMGLVCALLLVQHAAHLWWVVRPDAPLALPPAWLDAAMLAGLGAAWLAWWREGLVARAGA